MCVLKKINLDVGGKKESNATLLPVYAALHCHLGISKIPSALVDIVTDKVAAASKVTIHPGVMAHIAPLAGLPSSSPEKPQIENREELGLGTAKRKRRMIVVDDDDDEAGMLDREESPGLPAKQPKVQPKAAVQRVKNTGEDGGSDDEDED